MTYDYSLNAHSKLQNFSVALEKMDLRVMPQVIAVAVPLQSHDHNSDAWQLARTCHHGGASITPTCLSLPICALLATLHPVLWCSKQPQTVLFYGCLPLPRNPNQHQQAFLCSPANASKHLFVPEPCLPIFRTNLLHLVPHCLCFSFSCPASLANVSHMWLWVQKTMQL